MGTVAPGARGAGLQQGCPCAGPVEKRILFQFAGLSSYFCAMTVVLEAAALKSPLSDLWVWWNCPFIRL